MMCLYSIKSTDINSYNIANIYRNMELKFKKKMSWLTSQFTEIEEFMIMNS